MTQVGSQTYAYDANGNLTNRAGDALSYDVENRLTQVVASGTTSAYTYNGDGVRVKKVVSSTATYYVANWFEVTNSAATKYYYFGAQRVAMRTSAGVTYLHGDHLGSTSMTSGATSSTQTYYAFGAPRTSDGTLPTDYIFTGQRIDADAGPMYYGSRYYDATIGRFVQPDTIIQNLFDPQALNRYAYVRNNPLRYTDPTGHMQYCGDDCGTPGSYDYSSDAAPTDPGSTQPAASTGDNQGPGGGRGSNNESSNNNDDNCNMIWCGGGKPNDNASLKNCGHYCRVEAEISVGWVVLGISSVIAPLCPECAVFTARSGEGLVLASIGVTYASDIYGNNYGGLSLGFGKTPGPIAWDYIYSGEMFTDRNPSESTLEQFLTGVSVNGKLGMLGSGGITLTPGTGASTEAGIFSTSQMGISGSGSMALPRELPHIVNVITAKYPIPTGGH